jgi:hypothetical protein
VLTKIVVYAIRAENATELLVKVGELVAEVCIFIYKNAIKRCSRQIILQFPEFEHPEWALVQHTMTKHVGFVPHSYLARSLQPVVAAVTLDADVSPTPVASLPEQTSNPEPLTTDEVVVVVVSASTEVPSESKRLEVLPEEQLQQQSSSSSSPQQAEVAVLVQETNAAATKAEISSDSEPESPPIKRAVRISTSVIAPPSHPLSLSEMPVCLFERWSCHLLVSFAGADITQAAPAKLPSEWAAHEKSLKAHSFGFLNFRAALDMGKHELTVEIFEGRSLQSKDINGFSDPYIKGFEC